jgi:predicted methyltransferase
LLEKSEINANPLDNRDHPAGVWSLPPTLRICKQIENPDEAAACEKQYRTIGESDRMTLRFRKKL